MNALPRRQYGALAVVAVAATWLLWVAILPESENLTGTASVIDGDTIEIHGQRVRLHGVDAPERRQQCEINGTTQRCGQRAALALSDKIGRRTVACDLRKPDRHRRVIAVCSVGGEDLSRWLVREGWALAYRKYSTDYVADEHEAETGKRGIWGSAFVAPWEWRTGAR